MIQSMYLKKDNRTKNFVKNCADVAPPWTVVRLRRFYGNRVKVVNGCWLWQGSTGRLGYVAIQYKKRQWLGHRLSFFLVNGFVTPLLDHKICDTKSCVHPRHVVPSTCIENLHRAAKKHRDSVRRALGKLTVAKARRVRRLYKWHSRTYGGGALGRKFGVTPATIYYCVKGVTWKG